VAQLEGSHTMSIVSDLTIPARLVGIEEEAASTIQSHHFGDGDC